MKSMRDLLIRCRWNAQIWRDHPRNYQRPPCWPPSPLHQQEGSDGMNLALIWLDKKRDIAIVTVTNIGGKKTHDALVKLAAELYAEDY